jgi:hypothetical protein
MAAAPVAMIIDAMCLSNSPEKTTIDSFFFAPGRASSCAFMDESSFSMSYAMRTPWENHDSNI